MPYIRERSREILLWGICIIAFLYFFHNAIEQLLLTWGVDEYSYGYFVFPLAFLVSLQRLAAEKPIPNGSWWGAPIVVVGCLLQSAVELTGRLGAPQYSLVISLLGVIVAIFGMRVTSVIMWSMIYLLFAIRLPDVIYSSLSTQLQIISSTIGVESLHVLGFSAFQEGNIIDLGGYQLQVVEACSGLRYLFPLLSFSYLIAYMFQSIWWTRLLIFVSAVPISILMNSLRIAMVGATVDLWGIKMAEGVLHDIEGWTVFVFCTLLLLGESWLISLFRKGDHISFACFSLPRGPFLGGKIRYRAASVSSIVLLSAFSVAMFSGVLVPKAEIRPFHMALSEYPLTLGPWRGRADRLGEKFYEVLKPTDYLLADYFSGSETVNIYVAFYESQREAAPHSPELCIPSGGWQIGKFEKTQVDVAGTGKAQFVNRAIIQKGSQRQLVYYWFIERGRTVTNPFAARWYLFVDAIRVGRTDGALIRVVTPLSEKENEADGDARLRSYLTIALPTLEKFIEM